MSYGIKVSKAGKDVKTAADIDLSFSSEFLHRKIYTTGKIVGVSQEISHPFGYPIAFTGYILTSSKYFVHYNRDPICVYQFENSDYGEIKSDSDKVYLSSDVANKLIYILYVGAADPTSDPALEVRTEPFGIDVSEEGVDVKNAPDGKLSLASAYQLPNVVQSGEVTVSLPIIAPAQDADQTDYQDVSHSLGYAGHLILFDGENKGSFGNLVIPRGLVTPYTIEDTEVYIDSSKMRFRASRQTRNDTAPAKDYKFKYFLTNFDLPS